MIQHARLLFAAAFIAFAPHNARAASEIVIGQVAPFSGPLAPTGEHMRAGAQIYFERINAEGGIHGAKLRLVTKDDGYKISETVRLTRELLAEHKPLALFGLVGTGNVAALLEARVLDEEGIPAVGIRTGATSLIEPPHRWLFIGRASYATEVEKMVQHMSATGIRRIAVFYQDDPFGEDGLRAAERAAQALGVELAAKAGYEKNTTKVENAVATLLAAAPQSIVMISNTAASSEFVRQYRAGGGDAQLMALSTTDGPQVVTRIGKETAHGLGIAQVVPDPSNRAMAIVREVQEVYRASSPAGIELNHTLVQGYIGAALLVEGLRRAGPNPTRRVLRDALESLHDLDLGGITVNFSPRNHTGIDYVDITILNRHGRILR
jgi:ABC-type branched-subunit amino acid transport system substrate-binding protein